MSNKLSLIVNFLGVDKMSGALRNIVGLGTKGSKSIKGLTGESKKLERELAKVRRQLSSDAGNVTQLVNSERALERQIATTNQQMERQKRILAINADKQAMLSRAQDLTSKGQQNLIAGVAMSLPFVMATRQAMTFESSMADVRKVVDFPTPKAFAQMSDDILDMSMRIPMAAEGIAAIVAAAGRANIPRKELLRFAEDAAKMGVAFDMTGEEAGGMMAKWRTAFRMGQADVVRLSDQVNALTNTFGGEATAVAGVITRIGALGEVNGVAAMQVAAMAQLLGSVGVEEEVAATGIKNMMLAMTKGTSATKGQATALKGLGLDATELAERMQKDAGGAITDLMQRLAKLPKAQQAGILTQLFGSESVAAIAPMLTNLKQLQANFALVGDQARYGGSMHAEYLAAIAKTEGATGLALNAFKALNIELGQEFLPAVTSGSKQFVEMARSVRAWSAENPNLSSGIVKILTGLVMFRIGLGAAQLAIGGLLGPFAKVIPYFRKVDGISKFASHLKVFGSAAGRASTLAVKAFGYLRTATTFLASGVMKAAPILLRGFGMIRTAGMFLAQGVMRAGLMMMANPMVLAITLIVVALASAAYLIYTHWDKISATFKSGVEWVKGAIGGLPDWLRNIGSMMMQGLLMAINPMALASKLLDVARNGMTAFKNYFGIKSPSRLFMAMGGHLTTGLERGIDKTRRGPVRAIGRMASGVAAAGAMSLTPMQAAAGPASAGSAAGAAAGSIEIHVHGSPGMSVDDLADAVMRKLERVQAKRGRGSYEER